jgi:predicted CopG family antitoxin
VRTDQTGSVIKIKGGIDPPSKIKKRLDNSINKCYFIINNNTKENTMRRLSITITDEAYKIIQDRTKMCDRSRSNLIDRLIKMPLDDIISYKVDCPECEEIYEVQHHYWSHIICKECNQQVKNPLDIC